MAGTVGIDVLDGLDHAIDDTYGEYPVQVFGTPVLLGGRLDIGQYRARTITAPKRDAFCVERTLEFG